MTQTTQQDLKIIGGPGKHELMLGLFEGKEVFFSAEEGKRFVVKLLTIQREDGSNDSWNLDGITMNQFPNFRFHAYYSTRGNKGRISLRPLVRVI